MTKRIDLKNKIIIQSIQPFITCNKETSEQILKDNEIGNNLEERIKQIKNGEVSFHYPISIENVDITDEILIELQKLKEGKNETKIRR